MKTAVTLFLLFAGAIGALAQTSTPKPKTIQVIGTAEIEIVPDEIFMSIKVKEYMNKETKKKVQIEDLEKGLVNYLTTVVKMDVKDIKYDDMSAYIAYTRKKNKDEFISKLYDVKVKNAKQVYQIYSVMDSLGIRDADIVRYSHSKMDEYKKQVKIDAIKSAQSKATYLLDAVGAKVGKVVSVHEPSGKVSVLNAIPGVSNEYYLYNKKSYGKSGFNDEDSYDGGYDASSIEFKTI